jgi:hypothetical protein
MRRGWLAPLPRPEIGGTSQVNDARGPSEAALDIRTLRRFLTNTTGKAPTRRRRRRFAFPFGR